MEGKHRDLLNAEKLVRDYAQNTALNQICVDAAISYINRFYSKFSIEAYDWRSMSYAAIRLATKSYCYGISNDNILFDCKGNNFLLSVMMHESFLLQSLGYDVRINPEEVSESLGQEVTVYTETTFTEESMVDIPKNVTARKKRTVKAKGKTKAENDVVKNKTSKENNGGMCRVKNLTRTRVHKKGSEVKDKPRKLGKCKETEYILKESETKEPTVDNIDGKSVDNPIDQMENTNSDGKVQELDEKDEVTTQRIHQELFEELIEVNIENKKEIVENKKEIVENKTVTNKEDVPQKLVCSKVVGKKRSTDTKLEICQEKHPDNCDKNHQDEFEELKDIPENCEVELKEFNDWKTSIYEELFENNTEVTEKKNKKVANKKYIPPRFFRKANVQKRQRNVQENVKTSSKTTKSKKSKKNEVRSGDDLAEKNRILKDILGKLCDEDEPYFMEMSKQELVESEEETEYKERLYQELFGDFTDDVNVKDVKKTKVARVKKYIPERFFGGSKNPTRTKKSVQKTNVQREKCGKLDTKKKRKTVISSTNSKNSNRKQEKTRDERTVRKFKRIVVSKESDSEDEELVLAQECRQNTNCGKQMISKTKTKRGKENKYRKILTSETTAFDNKRIGDKKGKQCDKVDKKETKTVSEPHDLKPATRLPRYLRTLDISGRDFDCEPTPTNTEVNLHQNSRHPTTHGTWSGGLYEVSDSQNVKTTGRAGDCDKQTKTKPKEMVERSAAPALDTVRSAMDFESSSPEKVTSRNDDNPSPRFWFRGAYYKSVEELKRAKQKKSSKK